MRRDRQPTPQAAVPLFVGFAGCSCGWSCVGPSEAAVRGKGEVHAATHRARGRLVLLPILERVRAYSSSRVA